MRRITCLLDIRRVLLMARLLDERVAFMNPCQNHDYDELILFVEDEIRADDRITLPITRAGRKRVGTTHHVDSPGEDSKRPT